MSARIIALAVTLIVLFAAEVEAQEWRLAQPAAAPPARQGHAMAFDSGRARTVVFGGHEWGADRHFQDHWEFDGSTWTQRALSLAPSRRQRAGMCYDEGRGVVVLFGGLHNGGLFGSPTFYGDTWEFDGVGWTQRSLPGSTPSPRFAEMVYDSIRGVVVLYGGAGPTGLLRDTWEYDGVRWTLRNPSARPPAGNEYVLAFDRRRRKVVAHPSFVMGRPLHQETWEWDGNDWARANAATLGPMFPDPAMTYDARRERVVLVGAGFFSAADSWEFDGSDWVPSPGGLPLLGLGGHELVFDSARGAVITFGGERTIGGLITSTNDTWEHATFAAFSTFGPSCSAVGPAPVLDAQPGSLPRIGASLGVELTNVAAASSAFVMLGNSDSRGFGTSLPVDMGPVGLPGCQLLTSSEFVFPMMSSGGVGGAAQWTLPIPADAALQETVLYLQGLVVGAGPSLQALSNGARLVIGL